MQASDVLQWWRASDAVLQAAALALLAMSVASWVAILAKLALLARARTSVLRASAALWQAGALQDAPARVAPFDHARLVLPLVQAALQARTPAVGEALDGQGAARELRATRLLRGALHGALARLQAGQVLLATVGATAPFVGLLGTVWGIHHALAALAGTQQISIERLAGPVGEALVMTAAGLAVALPAVLAYNGFGRAIGAVEAELEGLAHDLRALLLEGDDAPLPGPRG
ncbi:biopolymer transport protein ExbB [Oryzisolibacter propanilivorax]|uniref:Biopolymer transport protein ExbB n=1 Tax=Oryzisolibacter propanilivorax TaxID=1527607 RepID=A0A1G9Q4N4_9BURK|nr:MotA/TolQ/ExbB proton channel family protein [Oryzisolibacter propanilivorax]SDM06002.1 biopolymer transport protein ExbB [Oryzisolibacter propanilivorax]